MHDAKINSYEWVQIIGPTNANILNKNAVVANATGLTIGSYTFEVRIVDDSNNNASSRVTITVVQGKQIDSKSFGHEQNCHVLKKMSL